MLNRGRKNTKEIDMFKSTLLKNIIFLTFFGDTYSFFYSKRCFEHLCDIYTYSHFFPNLWNHFFKRWRKTACNKGLKYHIVYLLDRFILCFIFSVYNYEFFSSIIGYGKVKWGATDSVLASNDSLSQYFENKHFVYIIKKTKKLKKSQELCVISLGKII